MPPRPRPRSADRPELEDFHLREKIRHFDHWRIPARRLAARIEQNKQNVG